MRSRKQISSDLIKVLIQLLKLLMSPRVNGVIIIQYMEQHQIDPNVYLPSIDGTTQMPVLYYCCSLSGREDVLEYLLRKGANIHHSMMVEPPQQPIELLYYSQVQYIPRLIQQGAKLNPDRIQDNLQKLVIRGNITKLITLYQSKAITKEQVVPVIQQPGLLFRILDQLYEKVFQLSQQVQNETQFTPVYQEILKNFIKTFKFFAKNGASFNQIENGESFIQKVLNTYFVPLIQVILDTQTQLDTEELLHYSNFELLNRQVMCFIYNENNYRQINDLLKNKIKPKKIILKKTLIKKVIRMGADTTVDVLTEESHGSYVPVSVGDETTAATETTE